MLGGCRLRTMQKTRLQAVLQNWKWFTKKFCTYVVVFVERGAMMSKHRNPVPSIFSHRLLRQGVPCENKIFPSLTPWRGGSENFSFSTIENLRLIPVIYWVSRNRGGDFVR